MTTNGYVPSDEIRESFSAAMSAMYRNEVPAYGTLMELVATVNSEVLERDPDLTAALEQSDQLNRISQERHGAIRVGTAAELNMIRRLFAVMGMFPVGYYDLSEAGVPVHSTAFRPVGEQALRRNPFRVFTSLLRLDLISDRALRDEAENVLQQRKIFTTECLSLIDRAEANGGLTEPEAAQFVSESLETFRWHSDALVDANLYRRLPSRRARQREKPVLAMIEAVGRHRVEILVAQLQPPVGRQIGALRGGELFDQQGENHSLTSWSAG